MPHELEDLHSPYHPGQKAMKLLRVEFSFFILMIFVLSAACLVSNSVESALLLYLGMQGLLFMWLWLLRPSDEVIRYVSGESPESSS